ncbi:vWA domain-containing protein [Sungkyunkwania multivorans]|uniref:VWA domain-containing protein n=1 Tax=Sungkyunkwania multivorans TaxID=1173618 RepID=A0ABW3CZL0_9FLAO
MLTTTILYIILAGIAALLAAFFHYFIKGKGSAKRNVLFGFLRFVTFFGVLLLLINPQFKQVSYDVEKPKLVLAVDNSSSIAALGQSENVQQLLSDINTHDELQDRFQIDRYTFGTELNASDTLSFDEKQTNIAKALSSLEEVYKDKTAPIVLITDGNQTFGRNYQYTSTTFPNEVFPVILGDTLVYSDLRLQQLNVNKYAYLNNKFPIEAIVTYQGQEAVNSQFRLSAGNTVLYRKNVSFSKEKTSEVIQIELPATRVGVQTLQASITPLPEEQNKENNSKYFAIEVIDEKTNIAIVSSMKHPDIGALKKSLESNKQRSVTIVSPSKALADINQYQLLVVFQPDFSFSSFFTALDKEKKNALIIAGTKTSWNLLNRAELGFTHDLTGQVEDVQPIWNINYNSFITEDIGFDGFPPLRSSFGDIKFSIPFDVLLYKKIGSVETQKPLLTTFQKDEQKYALLLGEDLWRWRAQTFLDTRSFESFDAFLGKITQYLASNKRKQRLDISYESFYYGNAEVKVSAQYFDRNYIFDNRGTLRIVMKSKATQQTQVVPMLLRNNYYQADLSSMPAGDYDFTVQVVGEELSRSGSFSILAFDVEKQFLNADVTKLQQLATNTSGNYYFAYQKDQMINDLLTDQRYTPIQKRTENVVPLIDWKWLLAIIALSLASEWFLRKYNGLI